jgi:VanZ family protein
LISRKSQRVRALITWTVTLAWAALIFNLSTETYGTPFSGWLLREILGLLHLGISPATFLILHHHFRKLAHLTEYAILSGLLYGCLESARPFPWRPRAAFACILAAGAYALTDEFHQAFVPGRTASWIDCGIDTAGASLGMVVVYGSSRVFRSRNRKTALENLSAAEK